MSKQSNVPLASARPPHGKPSVGQREHLANPPIAMYRQSQHIPDPRPYATMRTDTSCRSHARNDAANWKHVSLTRHFQPGANHRCTAIQALAMNGRRIQTAINSHLYPSIATSRLLLDLSTPEHVAPCACWYRGNSRSIRGCLPSALRPPANHFNHACCVTTCWSCVTANFCYSKRYAERIGPTRHAAKPAEKTAFFSSCERCMPHMADDKCSLKQGRTRSPDRTKSKIHQDLSPTSPKQ